MPLDHLSDLEVLHLAFEQREQERRDTHDRYMGLLVAQRKHGERVSAAERATHRRRADEFARWAVTRWIGTLTKILGAVEVLPERPGPDRVALLKQIARDTRWELSLTPQRPVGAYDQASEADARAVRAVRAVVGVLRTRDGIDADDVVRLVEAALNEGDLDIVAVAATGTLRPEFQPAVPEFEALPGWTDRVTFHAFEPEGALGARVVACSVGSDWHLDLHSPTGRLLAYGVTAEPRVALTATALIERAPAWAREPNGYAWKPFAATAALLPDC
ncbi:hypothetical protein [Streptacidiphilus sp. EB103A]|uniref:hypothetical protein n=1 Tax=Streptacidiphilus sp. EB103A TaxID=3156275 RepID=UPI0035197913